MTSKSPISNCGVPMDPKWLRMGRPSAGSDVRSLLINSTTNLPCWYDGTVVKHEGVESIVQYEKNGGNHRLSMAAVTLAFVAFELQYKVHGPYHRGALPAAGTPVRWEFPREGWFDGVVVRSSLDKSTVQYTDGETQTLDRFGLCLASAAYQLRYHDSAEKKTIVLPAMAMKQELVFDPFGDTRTRTVPSIKREREQESDNHDSDVKEDEIVILQETEPKNNNDDDQTPIPSARRPKVIIPPGVSEDMKPLFHRLNELCNLIWDENDIPGSYAKCKYYEKQIQELWLKPSAQEGSTNATAGSDCASPPGSDTGDRPKKKRRRLSKFTGY